MQGYGNSIMAQEDHIQDKVRSNEKESQEN